MYVSCGLWGPYRALWFVMRHLSVNQRTAPVSTIGGWHTPPHVTEEARQDEFATGRETHASPVPVRRLPSSHDGGELVPPFALGLRSLGEGIAHSRAANLIPDPQHADTHASHKP